MNLGAKFYFYLALSLAGLGALWVIHHSIYSSGYTAGVISQQKTIDEAHQKIAALNTDKANLKSALAKANAATALAKAQADEKLASAAVVIQRLAKENETAQAQLDAWHQKFKSASAQPDCAALAKVQVCPSLADY